MTQHVDSTTGCRDAGTDQEAYRRGLEVGAKFHSVAEPASDPNERLVDSQQLAEILQVPVTWIQQAEADRAYRQRGYGVAVTASNRVTVIARSRSITSK